MLFILAKIESPSPKEALGSNPIAIGRRNHRQNHFGALDKIFTNLPLMENVNKFMVCVGFNYSIIY
jgi:hypothetical protein